jgi:hypothetical protein
MGSLARKIRNGLRRGRRVAVDLETRPMLKTLAIGAESGGPCIADFLAETRDLDARLRDLLARDHLRQLTHLAAQVTAKDSTRLIGREDFSAGAVVDLTNQLSPDVGAALARLLEADAAAFSEALARAIGSSPRS